MEESKKRYLSISHGVYLFNEMCPRTRKERDKMKSILYAATIGSIMYIMLCKKINVSYALTVYSIYQSDPKECHWIVIKNILKHLNKTKDMFLVY